LRILDYDYVRFPRNRPSHYGDGWTEVERNGRDPVAYMDAIDYPPVMYENGDHKISSVINGTIDFGDEVKAKGKVPAVTNESYSLRLER